MKVYLAATYSMREQLAKYAEELKAAGIEVTSRWLSETEEPDVQIPDLPTEKHIFYGNRDVEDVVEADILVSFNDPKKHFRQGRTAEFGMALAIDQLVRPMPIFVVGDEHEHIFHYQKNVAHFSDWESAKTQLINFSQLMSSMSGNFAGL